MKQEDFSIPMMHQTLAASHGAAKGNLSAREFVKLSNLIEKYCGIVLSETKKIHVENKIGKRIKQIGLSSFDAYLQFIDTPAGYKQEIFILMDIVTTNKTDFFREPAHFDFIRNTAINQIQLLRPQQQIKIWSAGCSSGEEPYTLAMVMTEILPESWIDGYAIFATDISGGILREAQLGIYELEKIAEVPLSIKQKYFLKSRITQKPIVRVVPDIRQKVKFAYLNLMNEEYELPEKMDIIFCRNVIIYFDKAVQQDVVRKLAGQLAPGGYLFLGHSETILGMDVPLERVASTIYRRID
ncbi:MAG: protein-glutamate O-methyltransferase CheR [Ignavibacteriales bacterium]|nr:protein-glutamate O-methyltransferase CheR [Ignavibacteriales bacterium]